MNILDDEDKLCAGGFKNYRKERNIIAPSFVCVDSYKKSMMELVAYFGQYPAELIAFRSTNAGWMRYGNYGFGWNLFRQKITSSPNFIAQVSIVNCLMFFVFLFVSQRLLSYSYFSFSATCPLTTVE